MLRRGNFQTSQNESIQQLVPIVPALRTSFGPSARYFILSGDDDGYFHIDPSNGDLYLMRQLDRESLPESAVGDRFSLVIQVTDGVKSVQTRVVVEVEDINDNRPRFHFNEHLISIVENLPVGFNVLQLTATDPDLVRVIQTNYYSHFQQLPYILFSSTTDSMSIYIGREWEIYFPIDRFERCFHDRSNNGLAQRE